MLAAALEGKFPSWFEGTEKPVRGFPQGYESLMPNFPPPEELPDMPPEAKEARIIVIGDSDMPGILLQISQNQRNLDFMVQSADWLSNDDDIAEIRNRRSYAGRLDRITDKIKRIGAAAFSQVLNVFFLPLGIIIFGIVRAVKRKTRKEHADAV
jgi:ABC-type uncharacterized transport system involved in gliding motility auxiliary subunit